jgi:hypothetical protein
MKTEIARAEKIAAINRMGRAELIDRHYQRIPVAQGEIVSPRGGLATRGASG